MRTMPRILVAMAAGLPVLLFSPAPANDPFTSADRAAARNWALNLTFGDDPGRGSYDGAIGKADDYWNLVKTGTRKLDGLTLADGRTDDVSAEISENDGGWGITDHRGVFHGYIYHNCRCVDLSVSLTYVPAGLYEVLVYAHGDAPDQNSHVVIESAGVTYSGRATQNDGSWRFRTPELKAGIQYVRYLIEVKAGSPIRIISKRDGSSYSMFNAIQLRQLKIKGGAHQ